jgi:hypothetical protein
MVRSLSIVIDPPLYHFLVNILGQKGIVLVLSNIFILKSHFLCLRLGSRFFI